MAETLGNRLRRQLRVVWAAPTTFVRTTGRHAVATVRSDDSARPRYVEAVVEDVGKATNLEWNRTRWGQRDGWESHDRFGYQWGGGHAQTVGALAAFADEHFAPFTDGNHELRIMELSCGGGRFTAELIRYAASMTLVDFTAASLDVCRERFRYYPTPIEFVLNDGVSLDGLQGQSFDAIACYDSMVHMHPTIIEGYVAQMATLVAPSGFIWLDHSGKGARESGHRTDMTAEQMCKIAARHGFDVASQRFRNSWDCVTVMHRPGVHDER